MTYDIQLLWKLFENISSFDYENEDFTDETCEWLAEEVMDNTNLTIDYEIGATKLVLIPEELDYVIKIPFNGENDWFHGYGFQSFYGLPASCANYCEYEKELYQKAEAAGVEKMFLPLEYVGIINTIPIYIQEKASFIPLYNENSAATEKSKNYLIAKRKINKQYFPPKLSIEWVAKVLDFLGSIEELEKFLLFIKIEEIDKDLHVHNYGFIGNNQPIIFDYGGYFEEVSQ